MMDRGRTGRKYNGCTRGSNLIYVVLLMTFLIVLSSKYMAISRYNMKAALNNRRYMEAQLSSETIHRSLCEAVGSGESPAMSLIWQSFQEDCDRLREEFDETMNEEGAEEGEDGELKAETPSLGEGTDAEEDMATEEDTAAEEDVAAKEEIRREQCLCHALGNKEYMVREKGISEDSGIIDDDAAETPTADSPTTIDIALAVQPLKSLVTVHTWAVGSGCSFFLMANIVFDDEDGSVMITRKPYRSSGRDGPEVKICLNGNGVYRYYGGS